ncbi:MAG TPA: leucyl aminopeptidase family protein, partial [Gammaproteobacteria bacterium]|nr:leucyl aminopeptidase family protein [Gammaproteobacteria bacterium]
MSQSPRQPTRRTFESFDHVIVVVPAKPTGKLLQRIPQGAQLRKLLSRAGGESAGSRLTNRNATGITIAAFTATTSFDQLSWARQIVTNCQRDKPGRIGVFSIGLDEEARTAALTSLVAAVEAAAFKLPSFKSSQNKHRQISNLTLLDCKQRVDLRTIHAQALGNDIARWFTALPPNKLDARTYRDAVRSLAKDNGIAYNFLNEAELEKLGAGAFLAVSQGNPGQDAGIIHLRYRPKRRKSPDVALVGKGVLFDTGGTNLKPFKSMLDMHTDMQGSAVALGTIIGLASLQAPFAIDAWMAVTENRISSVAYKSQDIVRASNGTTIQVIHTDAEGRMVLADTLALAAREQPGLIIDYATLTGSCVAALTENYSGVFSNRAAANPLLRQA